MADKIVSPGVFTKENDLSFLQQGVADIGAAFIGPFNEGPVVPTIVNSQAEFEQLFGAADGTYYTPLAVQNYLREAGTATICRVAGVGGYTETAPLLLTVTSGSVNAVSASLGILFNTSTNANAGFAGATLSDLDGKGDFSIAGTGLGYTASLYAATGSNIEAVFGTSPLGSKGAYSYGFFKNSGFNVNSSATSASVTVLGNQLFTFDASEANTPYIQSQLIAGTRTNLFKFETLGVGNSANTKVKVGITNIKSAGSVNGTDYGTFTVVVRDFSDTDKKKVVLETYSNVNLDPNSPNFISRVIGDRYLSIDNTGKITETGDWANNSKYIRITDLDVTKIPVQAVPFGHSAYSLPISASAVVGALIPAVTFSTGSVAQSGSTLSPGIDLENNSDNGIYLKPIPTGAGVGANSSFGLDTASQNSLQVGDTRAQFIVAFQNGFDGMSPATVVNKGADINAGNSQGFNLTNAASSGSVAYMKAINALSNSDEWDINMIVAPGVIQNKHLYISTALVDLAEQRADAFLLLDSTVAGASVVDAVNEANALDTNYAASYYPWIKTIDVNTNKLITVPPSVLLPGVFAANDRVAAEWFAPAGLNRGGLTGAVSVLNRLTQSEKDDLYEGKVNPIVQFPGQGIVVFGQKTLQDKPSALDRINVRRLLLTVRKYIASTSRYLVFEQNTSETRNRFLNIVNPYLESIQQRQGLYAFRVVMDESNNTPDVIDRNIMKGAIYLQPTKTAEFIQIDFNILPTGASFNG
jgi:phage tail sheath protein FI